MTKVSERKTTGTRRLLLLGAAALCLALAAGAATRPAAREWRLRRTSLADLEREAKRQPGDAQFLCWLGRKRMAAEQLDGAVAAYRQAIDAPSGYPPAWAGLAEALRRLGREEEAFPMLEAATAREPRSAEAHASLALLYDRRGDVPRALETAGRATEIDPRSPAGWFALGAIHHRLQHPGRSLDALRTAARLAPEEARYQQLLGEALRDSGRLDEAEPYLRKARELAPDFPATYLSLGQLYAARSPSDAYLPLAVQALERARELAPRDWAAHYHLGRAYLRQRRFAAAIAAFKPVIDLAPDFDPVLLDLSRAYAGLGDRERARLFRESFEMASENYQQIEATRLRLAHAPENPALHFQLARLYLERGRNRAAYDALQTGLARDPQNAWARAALRRLQQGVPPSAPTPP
jgi:tetratricopeptide (TPR) repeat protein